MLRAKRGLVHSRDDSAAARSANSRRRESMSVADALSREPVQIWRNRVRISKTRNVRANILAANPNDIRLLGE